MSLKYCLDWLDCKFIWRNTVFTVQSINQHFSGSLFNASTALLTLYSFTTPVPHCPSCRNALHANLHFGTASSMRKKVPGMQHPAYSCVIRRPARFGPNCHRQVKLMITTHFGLVLGLFWAPKMSLLGALEVLQVTRFGPKCPRGPISRGSIGTSDNFYVLMTTGPQAVLLYCMLLNFI